METEDEKYRREEKERKKAEVRRRLEEEAKAHKAKKGFLTPERKKKLRGLLRRKAADELKKEQERKAEERRKTIRERAGKSKHEGELNEAMLIKICQDYQERISRLHDIKYDLEYDVKQKDIILRDLNVQISDLRGKFLKPNLKKVSKYEQKLEKMKQIAQKESADFRGNLKKVKSGIFKFDDEKLEDKQR